MKCIVFLILGMIFGKIWNIAIEDDVPVVGHFISKRKNVTVSKDNVDIPVQMSIKVWDFNAKTKVPKVKMRPVQQHHVLLTTTAVDETRTPTLNPYLPWNSKQGERKLNLYFASTQANPVYRQVVVLLPEPARKSKDASRHLKNNNADVKQQSRVEHSPENLDVINRYNTRSRWPVSLKRDVTTLSPEHQVSDLNPSVHDLSTLSRQDIGRNRNLSYLGMINSRYHPTRPDPPRGHRTFDDEMHKNSRETYTHEKTKEVTPTPNVRRFNWKVRSRDNNFGPIRITYLNDSTTDNETPFIDKEGKRDTGLANLDEDKNLVFNSQLPTLVPADDNLSKNSTVPKRPKVAFTGGVIAGLAIAVLLVLAVLIGIIVYAVRNAIKSQKADAISTLNYTDETQGGSTYIRNNIFLPATQIEQSPPSIETDSFNSMESTFLTFSEICLKSQELEC